jgi:HSP20 family protein
MWLPLAEPPAPAPTSSRIDVAENDTEYQVPAELPDVHGKEISILVNGNQVEVSAEAKHEREVMSGGTVLHAERYFGKIQRSFTLGHEGRRGRCPGEIQ